METGERMTKEELWNLPTGTHLCCVDPSERRRLGIIRKRKNTRIFHTMRNGNPRKWEISEYSYYTLSSKEEYVLWVLEQ
jgi:hypothetical protein